jgi:hypothetical protein
MPTVIEQTIAVEAAAHQTAGPGVDLKPGSILLLPPGTRLALFRAIAIMRRLVSLGGDPLQQAVQDRY